MAENKKAYKRYFIIDELLRRRPNSFVSIEEMKEAIEDKLSFSVSKHSIELDIKFMREDPDTNAPIANKRGKGYYYSDPKFRLKVQAFSEEDVQSIKQALDLLKNYSQLGLPATFTAAVNKLNLVIENSTDDNIVLLDQNESYRGARYLAPLFNAIKDKKAIRFKYNKFNEELKAQPFREGTPLVLKEYLHIWYVLIYDPQKDTYRNYALDRMTFLEMDDKIKYIRPKGFSPKKYYQYAMGITVDNNRKPDNIKLKVIKPLLHYIIESPWHETQQLDFLNSDSAIVTLKVYAGSELLKEIMSWGPSVQVIEPKSLVAQVKTQIDELVELYH